MPTHVDVNWSPEATVNILRLLGQLLEPDVSICTWVRPEPKEENGKLVHYLGWPEYNPLVERFFEGCFAASDPANPYVSLPEDPPELEPGFVLKTESDIAEATANQVERWLLLTKRQERFSDGHIEDQFKNGMMRAAHDRLSLLSGLEKPTHA